MMKMRWSFALVLVAAGCLLQPALTLGGEKKPPQKKDEPAKDVVVNGELTNADLKDKVLTQSFCKTYTYKMTEGRTYQIDLVSGAFDAYLRLENPKGDQVAANDDFGGTLNSRIVYRAPATGDFQICAMSLGGGSTGKFTLTVKDITNPNVVKNDGKAIELKNVKGQATVNANLAANDPLYKGKRHKLFLFSMEAGKTYQIDMTSNAFDSYLFLEDPQANFLASDDDGGGFPHARITFKANKTGKHRIISTYFGNGNGEFTLTVRQTDGALREEKKNEEQKDGVNR